MLMLKLNLAGEYLTPTFYDVATFTSNSMASIVPLFIATVLSLQRLATEFVDSSHDPLQAGDAVRVLDCTGSELQSEGDDKTERADSIDKASLIGRIAFVSKQHYAEELVVSKVDPDHAQTVIRIKVRVSAPLSRRIKAKVLCRPTTGMVRMVEMDAERAQLQRVVGRKQALKLCAGVCKHIFACAKQLRSHDYKTDDAGNASEKDAQDQFKSMVKDVETELDVVHHLEDGEDISVFDEVKIKQALVELVRPVLEPLLHKHHMEWVTVKTTIMALDISEVQAVVDDPEGFLQRLMSTMGSAAIAAAIAKLRPHIEAKVNAHGLTWDDVLPAIELIDSVDEILAAIDDAEAFLSRLLASAKTLVIGKLRPMLEPLIARQHLQWEDILPALQLVDSMEELQAALSDPEGFLQRLMSTMGPAAMAAAIAKLRPHIEAKVNAHGLTWDDVLPAIELIDSVDEILAAIDDAEAFLSRLLASAKTLVIGKLRPMLAPLLLQQGLSFEELGPTLERMDSIKELLAGLSNPEAFLQESLVRVVDSSIATKPEPNVITQDVVSSADPFEDGFEEGWQDGWAAALQHVEEQAQAERILQKVQEAREKQEAEERAAREKQEAEELAAAPPWRKPEAVAARAAEKRERKKRRKRMVALAKPVTRVPVAPPDRDAWGPNLSGKGSVGESGDQSRPGEKLTL